jgi:repressor LexA
MGRVGAGAIIDVEFEQPPPDGYHAIELPFAFPDPVIAFEIEGDSMLPAYEPGEVIVCLRDQVRATEYYLGERVVVRLSTGQRFLKRLARGKKKGVYNLESWNARTIEDVRIEWVGEIIAAVNPGMIRRVERRHQRAKNAGGAASRKTARGA